MASFLRPLLALLALSTALGCQGRETTASPTTTQAASEAASPSATANKSPAPSAHGAPFYLETSALGEPTAGSDLTLTYTLRRTAARAESIEALVTLPAGVQLLGGSLRETLVETNQADLSRTLRLHLDSVPQEDLVVTADVRSPGGGAHATSAYRFGRPGPKLTAPVQGRPIRTTDGRNLGRPILLGK